MSPDPTLQSLAQSVVDQFDPERIILFGSHARGTPDPGSDIDLLVVMETSRRPAEQAAMIRQALRFPMPLDLIVRTPVEMEQRTRMGDWFLRTAVRDGIVLYERPHPGMAAKG